MTGAASIGKETFEIAPFAIRCLERNPLAGEVHELRNAIERAVVLDDVVRIDGDVNFMTHRGPKRVGNPLAVSRDGRSLAFASWARELLQKVIVRRSAPISHFGRWSR